MGGDDLFVLIDPSVQRLHANTDEMQYPADTNNMNRLFLLLGLGTLDLGRAAQGLLAVLALLACIGESKYTLARLVERAVYARRPHHRADGGDLPRK